MRFIFTEVPPRYLVEEFIIKENSLRLKMMHLCQVVATKMVNNKTEKSNNEQNT